MSAATAPQQQLVHSSLQPVSTATHVRLTGAGSACLCFAVCRTQLEQWAQEWDAPYFLCSDQLQFRQWRDDAWLDWLAPSLLPKAGKRFTNLSGLREAVRAGSAKGSRVSYSDAVRFLLVYRFGGIYIDGDTLLLRNLEPFAHDDFVYEWSHLKQGMNTAVFGAAQQSAFTGAVIQAALRAAVSVNTATGRVTFNAAMFNGVFHPFKVLHRIPRQIAARVVTLPSIPFDPIWLTADTPRFKTHTITQLHVLRSWEIFFTKPSSYVVAPAAPADVFKGAFTYHWHNTWKAPFVESSLIGQLVNTYERFLQGKQPNPYGLTASPGSVANSSAVQTWQQL